MTSHQGSTVLIPRTQCRGTDFTVSGSTLTFTTAPASGLSFFAILLGSDNGGTVTPTDGSVSTGKIAADAITSAKIADDAVTGDHIASSGAFAIGATGTSSSLAGIPFFSDTTNGSIYTHDVSGTDSTAARNTAYGLTTLDAITTGDDNTVMGHAAGTALQDGVENVAIGTNSMAAATSGSQNTCVGHNSGAALSSGSGYNVLLGHGAGASMTSGNRNIGIGVSSVDGFDTEQHNLGIGISALGGSIAGGEYNVAIGNYSGDAITSGDGHANLGYQTGSAVTTGYENVFIGMKAGSSEANSIGADPTTGYRNIIIGAYANLNDATHGHAIVMGYAIDGIGDRFTFGKPSNVVYNTFTSDANWTRSSDERLKTNITDVGWKALDFINELRPITFTWKDSKDVPKDMKEYNAEENYMDTTTVIDGLLAQEVKTAMDKHSMDNFSGWGKNQHDTQVLSKEAFVLPLIKAVQELSAKVKALEEA